MKSKYAWITAYAQGLAAQEKPGYLTYRRVSRMGGHYDNLSAIVCYRSYPRGDKRIWKSQGEVVKLVPSYISTAPLLHGSLHNKYVTS